jgi:transcriptional regulator GlxA family with amidase domain
VFETPELLANDLLRASAVDALYATAIAAFPIEVVGPSAPPGGTLPSTVRRAVAYIDDNVDAPIRIEDVAQAARLSVRGLQGAFQRHLGTTPGRALRAARLSAARTDLLAADPAVDSVTAIARRYGFYHLGRFAAEYRAQYGELPSATLQRDG